MGYLFRNFPPVLYPATLVTQTGRKDPFASGFKMRKWEGEEARGRMERKAVLSVRTFCFLKVFQGTYVECSA